MEIERKYLIHTLPDNYKTFPCRQLEQGYLCKEPVVRIRQDNDQYELTYKSKGHLVREEINMPLTKESYEHLRQKVDGRLITKKRYMIGTSVKIVVDSVIKEKGLINFKLYKKGDKNGNKQSKGKI